MKATFVKSQSEAPQIETFWFRPEQPVDFIAGQFIELILPHKSDNRGVKRWFTLSSSPTEKYLGITTKFSKRSSSLKQALQSLKTGTEVHIDPPMGDFVLPADSSIPLVFVAAGMGITPYRSIFKWLADTGEQRHITFIHAVSTEDDIIFQDVFDAAHIHATIVVSRPSDAWGGERGRLDGEHILKLARPSKTALIYIAGAEPTVETWQDQLTAQGVPRSQIITDFFHNYESI